MWSASAHVKWMYRSEIELDVYGTSKYIVIRKIHYRPYGGYWSWSLIDCILHIHLICMQSIQIDSDSFQLKLHKLHKNEKCSFIIRWIKRAVVGPEVKMKFLISWINNNKFNFQSLSLQMEIYFWIYSFDWYNRLSPAWLPAIAITDRLWW